MSLGESLISDSMRLQAADGHIFDIYRADPPAPISGYVTNQAKGVVIIVQEIFGVTVHIRSVAEQYAQAGYVALAPAFFDRIRPGIELTPQQADEGRHCASQLQDADTYADLAAAVVYGQQYGKVAVIGYCWGGTVAHVAACRLPIAAAISYYGTRTTQYLDEVVRAPVLYHFGELDTYLPPATIAQVKAANPGGEFHLYAGAKHAFNNDLRPDNYHPDAARLAWERSVAFLDKHLSRI